MLKKNTKIEISIALGGLLVIILAAVISYGTNFDDPISEFIKGISPAIIVRERGISVRGLNQALATASKLDPKVDSQVTVDRIIKQKKMEILIRKLKVAYSEKNVTDELVYYTTNKDTEYRRLIKTYFSGDQNLFIDHVVRPSALENVLKQKYNADFAQNRQEYDRITFIQRQMLAAEQFDDLAKKYSDDKLTGQFGGDLGFFELDELIPELKNKLETAKVGNILSQIVISRYGYHILYPVQVVEQEGKTLWQVKHILIETHGFDEWLEQQTTDIPVWVISS